MLFEWNPGDDPVKFDSTVIGALDSRYGAILRNCWTLDRSTRRPLVASRSRARMERQAFPFLVVSELLSVPVATQISFLAAFFDGGSSILTLDAWLDEGATPTETQATAMFHAILGATTGILDLPTGSTVLRRLHHDWFVEVSTMENEHNQRYRIPTADTVTRLLSYYSGELNSNLHTLDVSIGRYFTTVVGCSYDLAAVDFAPALERACLLFNVLRQIADDIADVKEDLSLGRPTLPLLLALRDASFLRKIKAAWRGRSVDENMFTALVATRALDEAANIADSVWRHAASVLANNINVLGEDISNHLRIFFDLKRAAIERVRLNVWQDPLPPYFVRDNGA